MKRQVPKPPPGIRPLKTLERILSKAGLASRTDSRAWIEKGRVSINDRVVRDPDTWVDLELDRVALDGRPLESRKRIYLLLHKPAGYLTTWRDRDGRPTIYDLIERRERWLIPVGRLDLDTGGLLLLTNDTGFAERMMNPDYKVPKTYLVTAASPLSDDQLDLLRRGVDLRDGPTRPAQVKRIAGDAFEITITEGRNRQVRRMVESLGSSVVTLVRTAIGSLHIGELETGRWRELTREEVAGLLQAASGGGGTRGRERGTRPDEPAEPGR